MNKLLEHNIIVTGILPVQLLFSWMNHFSIATEIQFYTQIFSDSLVVAT